MSFLDRFKPQPRWKHADPAIRAAAVAEIPDDPEHRGAIEELAAATRTCACAARRSPASTDVALLARLARVGAGRGPSPRRSPSGWSRSRPPRRTPTPTPRSRSTASTIRDSSATVAKSSPHDTVRAAALGRVHDVKALSSIARHATDPQTALDAVARVAGPGGAAEHRAQDRSQGRRRRGARAVRRSVGAGRARHARQRRRTARRTRRSSSARARCCRRIDEAEAARTRGARGVAAAHGRRILAESKRSPRRRRCRTRRGAARRRRGGVAATCRRTRRSSSIRTPTARFGALVEAARTAIAAHERAEAERRAAPSATTRRAQRASCDLRAARERARPSTRSTRSKRRAPSGKDCPGPRRRSSRTSGLRARFEEACRRAAERHENRQERERTHARLDELSAEAERLSIGPQDRAGGVGRGAARMGGAPREVRRRSTQRSPSASPPPMRACGCAPRSGGRPPSGRCGSRCSGSSS